MTKHAKRGQMNRLYLSALRDWITAIAAKEAILAVDGNTEGGYDEAVDKAEKEFLSRFEKVEKE